jgi:hypothetical protein
VERDLRPPDLCRGNKSIGAKKCNLQAMKESQVATTEKYIMTTAKEATDKDFEQMMQMLTGFWVTQIAGALASYSIADHLAKGPASAEEISKMAGIDSIAAFRLLAEYCGLLKDAGLRFSKSTPIRSQMAIIEALAA